MKQITNILNTAHTSLIWNMYKSVIQTPAVEFSTFFKKKNNICQTN